jgi:hypothetical protein
LFDWLKKKSQNARVYMCVKELKWDLEQSSDMRKAKVLAMAQLLRKAFSDDFPLEDVINEPWVYPREQIEPLYSGLEDMRNGAVVQLASLKKSFAGMGYKLPEDVEPHVKLTNRSLEVWMTSLGIGMAPDTMQDVQSIWQHLDIPNGHLLPAMSDLREMAARQQEYTGINIFDEMYVTDSQWAFLCDFRPDWS